VEQAIRLRVNIGDDHTIHLPADVPMGEAEVIVLFPVPAAAERARKVEARRRMFGRLRGQATIADDFDAPLPEEILREFDGGGAG
jgi:hypothetical protein